MPDLFGHDERGCRVCKHWTGKTAHVIEQRTALCALRDRFHPQQRTYADETCEQFDDAQRRVA